MRIKQSAAVVYLLLSVCASPSEAQSLAHERSAFAIIDPTYSPDKQAPQSAITSGAATWIYGQGELECYRLQLLRQRKDSAKLLVGYPGVFHTPYPTASFRLKIKDPRKSGPIKFRAAGQGKVFINGEFVTEFNKTNSFHLIFPISTINIRELRFEITGANTPPALLIEDKNFTTSSDTWEWKAEPENWQPASHFPQNQETIPPHAVEDPIVILNPVSFENGLYDFGRELIGYVVLKNPKKPKLFVGESKAEALDTSNQTREQTLDLVQTKDGFWMSAVPLAFRYVYTANNLKDIVQCKAMFHPVTYKGAFACSDTTLTRIWMSSAYTLRLCLHDFILDGIKRDRLPWTGDLAMSMLVNAYTFSDPEMVRRSLIALGRAGIGEKDINGIVDYSLWWVIAQDHYQLYFGDPQHLEREWPRIKETLDILSKRCNSSGFLIPEKSWLFIDWVDQKKWTALQILYWWAQESGARLAKRMGDPETETHLKKTADNLKINLVKAAWNEPGQLWNSDSTASKVTTRHPNFLAVISGLAPENQYNGIRKTLEDNTVDPVGTPYMAGFENMALARLGNIQFMLDRVRNYWGGMLEQGATTFWEAYDSHQNNIEQYMFYDRPYGKSLCHAWSSGPAAFLPSEIFGLRPLEDGWKRFSINPDIGKLEWVCGTIPTKFGNIEINIEKAKISVTIPAGTALEWKGKTIAGPRVIKDYL